MAEMQCRHPLVQCGIGAFAFHLHVPQAALVTSQGLAQRVEELRDRLLTLREVALGGRTDLVELGVGQRQELLVVLRQRLGGELREGPGQEIALLLGPPGGLEFGRAKQFELRHRNGACRFSGGGGLRHRLQLGRQRLGPGPGIAQAALGQPRRAGGAGDPGHVPGNADGETGGEADDHSEDHEANVTTGCVTDGDRLLPPVWGACAARHLGVVSPGPTR